MQRLSHYLPRLSRTAFFNSVSPLNVAAKFPISSSCLGVTARLMSSESRPPSDHITEAVNNQINNQTKTPLRTVFTPEQKWADRSKKAMEDAISSPPADAYAGRSVKNTGNLAVTFRSLNDILLRNKVRQTVRMTERHEKKGAKRRRLQSERWRKQFANEVRKKVQLVIKIRDRGA